jgi:hypothetical protein
MTVEEIHRNLLGGLKTAVQSHANLIKTGHQHFDTTLHQSQISCSQARVTTAKTMCSLAGIEEAKIRLVVDVGMAT